jgi:hypothetical protein
VQELDLSDEEAFPGRHRAPASVARSAGVRLGLAALGVLLAIGLGVATADLLGLSEAGTVASQSVSLRELSPSPEEQPGMRRTVDLDAVPAFPPGAPEADAAAADPSPQPPPSAAAEGADEPPSASHAAPPPSPAAVRTVRTGDSCPAVGRTAVTGKGEAAVCTASRGNGPNKWRAA